MRSKVSMIIPTIDYSYLLRKKHILKRSIEKEFGKATS